ncbi:MAG: hypothetical protein ABJA98_01670 [Acidobacteriota bacterium]
MKRAHPGRPPLDDDDPSVDVHLRMPSKQYDDAYKRAGRERVSVPEQIRKDMRDAAQRTKA